MPRIAVLAAAIALALAAPPLAAQDNAGEDDPRELEQVVVTGTRVAGRSATETVAPIDIVPAQTLQRSGTPELNQTLSIALPSFNFPRPGLTDGTDTIRPATLRGLAPDQSLVLVNSKRRHTASLVNINGTVGRGAAAVDLNTIPIAAVQGIEVLRDGASAQYGSDAISGVINVLLRRDSEGGGGSLSVGRRESSYTTPTGPIPAGANWSAPAEIERKVEDGQVTTVSVWKGLALGESGHLTLSAEYKDQERTERGGYDYRQQYPRRADGSFDPREATFDRFNAWYGEPEMEQKTLFINAASAINDTMGWYGWASVQDRSARSAGFYRRALDDRNTIQIYPDGFLPIIAPDVLDASAAFGLEWSLGEWSLDSSLVWGRNRMDYTILNTLNRSLGPASGTEFDAGGFAYEQVVFNVSGVRSFDVGSLASPLNLATGLEARRENYEIFAGEPDSWRNGGVLLPNGGATQSGAQVFPGFQPGDVTDEDRDAVGAYVDLEANLTEKLLGSAALRAEDYSDFGSNLTGKLALRYDITPSFALRGSLQNGFRAPSPQQQFFTATSTNFINGVPFDILTFAVDHPAAVALGAKPLDAEESFNVSLGAVFSLGPVNITLDAYRIDIDDRIVLSENLGTTLNAADVAVRNFLSSSGFIGITGGRFFINGVDTETRGIDLVANWTLDTDSAGRFDFTLAANRNDTEVTRVPVTEPLSALNPPPVLFGRVNVLTFEEGTPKHKVSLASDWQRDRWGATVRATRYGQVLNPGTAPQFDFVLSPKTLVDIEARYDLSETLRLAVGAENVFDQYPDPFPTTLNGTGNTPFSNYSPFGRSGRFIYARLGFEF